MRLVAEMELAGGQWRDENRKEGGQTLKGLVDLSKEGDEPWRVLRRTKKQDCGSHGVQEQCSQRGNRETSSETWNIR